MHFLRSQALIPICPETYFVRWNWFGPYPARDDPFPLGYDSPLSPFGHIPSTYAL